jgi:hypothetical protein
MSAPTKVGLVAAVFGGVVALGAVVLVIVVGTSGGV